MPKKKKWKKPQLIVLVRGRPEESVLTVCKYYDGIISGPNNDNVRCHVECTPTCDTDLPT